MTIMSSQQQIPSWRCSALTPLGMHRIEVHGGNDYFDNDIECKTLSYETEVSSGRALRAFWISSKSPERKNRNKCLSTTNDLPFAPLDSAPHCHKLCWGREYNTACGAVGDRATKYNISLVGRVTPRNLHFILRATWCYESY